MTVTIDLVVETRGGDVTLSPVTIVDTVELGVFTNPVPIIEIFGGAPGPAGERGPGGSDPVTFQFPQAQSTWICPHNLHGKPNVVVVDGEQRSLLVDVYYDTIDTVRIEFGSPTVGAAYIG